MQIGNGAGLVSASPLVSIINKRIVMMRTKSYPLFLLLTVTSRDSSDSIPIPKSSNQ